MLVLVLLLLLLLLLLRIWVRLLCLLQLRLVRLLKLRLLGGGQQASQLLVQAGQVRCSCRVAKGSGATQCCQAALGWSLQTGQQLLYS
jgi:hypothetical protein